MSPKVWKRLPVVVAATLFPLAAMAECPGESQSEMNRCAGERAGEAAKAVDAAYAKLHTHLDEEGQKDLRRSQDSWSEYVQSWCLASTADSRGGSIRPLEIAMCHEDRARQREKELMASLSGPEGT